MVDMSIPIEDMQPRIRLIHLESSKGAAITDACLNGRQTCRIHDGPVAVAKGSKQDVDSPIPFIVFNGFDDTLVEKFTSLLIHEIKVSTALPIFVCAEIQLPFFVAKDGFHSITIMLRALISIQYGFKAQRLEHRTETPRLHDKSAGRKVFPQSRVWYCQHVERDILESWSCRRCVLGGYDTCDGSKYKKESNVAMHHGVTLRKKRIARIMIKRYPALRS